MQHESGFYQTCNIAYRRAILDELDGFDERFKYPCGDLFGWRSP